MREKQVGIYKITSPSNGVYIGQSIDCVKRKQYYLNGSCKNQRKLYYSILKYGWENHKFEVIHKCLPEELNDLENYYISLYNSFNTENGLNLKSGGHYSKLSEEVKRKISETKKGTPAWNKGIPMSKESKIKLSNSVKGKASIRKGVPTGKRSWNRGIACREETKLKLSEAKKGQIPWNRKSIICSETGIIYSSIKEAAIAVGLGRSYLGLQLQGLRKNKTTLKYL